MKNISGGLAAVLLAVVAWAQPAAAQGVPQGSYLRSCSEVRMRGDSLVALCRRPDGRGNWTWLNEVRRCRGDIGNDGGWLNCNFAGPPGPVPPPYPDRAERRRERCDDLRQEARQLQRRIDREPNPVERARFEGRLQELDERLQRCPRY